MFKTIPKEKVLPDEINAIPYSDLDITLALNRGYLKNLHIAQLIHYSEINKKHKILHLGALTGYVTSLIANLCSEVIAIETNDDLNLKLKNNIKNLKLNNIKIEKGSFKDGFESGSPYDVIFIDAPINKIGEKILNQLNKSQGKLIMIEKENNNLSKAIKITKNENNYSKEYLFDVFSKYELFSEKKGFKF